MEFGEKLQELRKSRGLTQQELAEALYVSRTAISKWESGRGYPSIDSLKEISGFFSVSIDDLLSGEKLVSLAKKENQSNIRHICDLRPGRKFCVSDIRQSQEYHVINVHIWGLFPLVTAFPGGWGGMRAEGRECRHGLPGTLFQGDQPTLRSANMMSS